MQFKHAKFLLQQAQASPGHFSLKIKVKTDKFNTIDLHRKIAYLPINQFYKHFKKKENVSIQIRMA